MPFGTVPALKTSALYKRSAELQSMPAFRLSRFVSVFDLIFQKKKEGGASDEEAEATAIAMAFAAAKRFQPMPVTATLEEQRHLFATMAPIQFSLGGEVQVNSFDYLRKNLDLINAAVAGNGFNLDHDHSEPTGMIHRLLLPDDASIPAEVKATMQADTPFVVEGSFYVDTPESIKATTALSSEWLAVTRKDGMQEVMLPDSFCIALHNDPATGEDLGVKRLSTSGAEAPAASPKSFEGKQGSTAPKEQHSMADGDPPNTTPEQLMAKVAALSLELENERKARAAATLTATAYKAEFEASKKVVDDLKSTAQEQAAELAALAVVQAGKASADQVGYFASLYKRLGKEEFDTLVASLPQNALGAYAIRASVQAVATPEQVKAHKERMAALLREG